MGLERDEQDPRWWTNLRMNRPRIELTPRNWTVTVPPLKRCFSSVLHRTELLQPELDALVVVVVDVIMHAHSSASMVSGLSRWKYSAFRVPRKL